jgi:hypothetical protein
MKIRYIAVVSKKTDKLSHYFIEEKRFFGWKRIGYYVDMGYGGFYEYFTGINKKELLIEVLMFKKKCFEFTKIIEYPTIKEIH